MTPQLLDLYGGAGGAAEGYRRAGWHVTSVDKVKRVHRPAGVDFIRGDVLDLTPDFLAGFDAVHASPPCKPNTRLTTLMDAQGGAATEPDLLEQTRALLDAAGRPYVIENVEGAPMRADVVLCGSMFGLGTTRNGQPRWLKRHRLFELGGWDLVLLPQCSHPRYRPLGVYGSAGDDIPAGAQIATLEEARELMDMPWASWAGITQAIPPAYTCYLGAALLDHVRPNVGPVSLSPGRAAG